MFRREVDVSPYKPIFPRRTLLVFIVGETPTSGIDRAEFRKSAVFNGDVITQRISIEEGAYLRGKVDIQGKADKAAGK